MKVINKFLVVLLITLVAVSCRNEDKFPQPNVPNGGMVLLDAVTTPVFNVTDIANAVYAGTFRDPVGNVESIQLYAFLTRGTTVLTDTALVKTITDVNAAFTISTAELVAAWDDIASTDDFVAGDRIDFRNVVTTKTGQVYGVDDIGPDLAGNVGQRSGFRFTTFISCPFDATEAAGTYAVVTDTWGDHIADGSETVDVVANAAGTGIIIEGMYSKVNGFGELYNVEVLVDANTGAATVARQTALNFNWYGGTPFGLTTVDGSGWVFGCSGTVTLRLTFRVAAGSFGARTYELSKI